MEQKNPRLIHVARIQPKGWRVLYLYLRQHALNHFVWTLQKEDEAIDHETGIAAISVAQAIQEARRHWKLDAFRTVHCGFRYTLPERDEHGCNALFCQMVASYSSSNGVYYEEELGYNCFVNFASQEALSLWKQLKPQ